MLPDDERHGTHRGLPAHKRAGQEPCEACRVANRIYQRRARKLRAMYGDNLVDVTGSIRRVQALMALGWSMQRLSRLAGMNQRGLWLSLNRPSGMVQRRTALSIASVYDKLSMSLPDPQTRGERISVSKTRAHAERLGYAPPMAWDNIDDPDERPKGLGNLAADRGAQLADFDAIGLGISEVCRRLDASRDTLQRWCSRNGMSETYMRLVGREAGMDRWAGGAA